MTYLFLHSPTGWSYEFRHVLPSLISAGHRVIVPDLIGFGKSDKPKRGFSHLPAASAQILIELIERLDSKNIVLGEVRGKRMAFSYAANDCTQTLPLSVYSGERAG